MKQAEKTDNAIDVTTYFQLDKRSQLKLLVAALVLAAGAAQAESPRWVADELLVKSRPGVSREKADAVYREHGAKVDRTIDAIGVHVLRVPPQALEKVELALSKHSEIEFVEKNMIVKPAFVPDDPSYLSQWHHTMIGMPAAWDLTEGSPEIVIAILDTGVDGTHPDLAAKMVPGYNFYDNSTDTSDQYGHGTKVAGVAAAIGNNAFGVAGAAWGGTRLMPIRISDAQGSGSLSAIAEGLVWASDNGARVMNVSFSDLLTSATVRHAARYVVNHGGVVVIAAGNCACDDPSKDNPYMISVGSTDASDSLAATSSRGAFVDLAAPGVGIVTTTLGGGIGSGSGTSFASPLTAGVVALMLSVNPKLTQPEVVMMLESTAIDLGTPGWDSSFGFGRLNASAAVLAAATSATPPLDTTAPAVTITSPAAAATVSGTVTVDALTTDDVGVVRVELLADGAVVGSDEFSPSSFAWDTTLVSDGIHELTAIAYDAAGNQGSSATVTVTVANALADSAAPIVAIVSPFAGQSLSGWAAITVAASDEVEMRQVDAYVDGQLIGTAACSTAACSPTFRWNAAKAPAGLHSLTARAVDASGNESQSTGVSISVGKKNSRL